MEPLSVCAEPARVIDPWGLGKCSVNGANAYSPAYEIKLAKTAYPGGGAEASISRKLMDPY